MSDLVTGEAVVLGLRTAKLPTRALARLLDALVQFVGFVIISIGIELAAPGMEDAVDAAVSLSVFVFFMAILPILVETLSHGQSLGKAAFGLRVVREDGGPIRFRHALVRGLVGVLEFGIGAAPAVISSMVSEQGRRLGDVFAGTLVVRERLPKAARNEGSVPPVPPAVLHAIGVELAGLDLSAVPDGLWLAVRQFLVRYSQLDPAVAHSMAERLAADLVAATGRPIPLGMQPALFLGAVLTERQRREWAKATAQGGIQAQVPVAAPNPWVTAPHPPVPYGQPPYGQPGYAQPGYGQPAYGHQPPYAQPGYAPQPSGQEQGRPPARVLGYPQAPAVPVPAPPVPAPPAPPAAAPAPVAAPAPAAPAPVAPAPTPAPAPAPAPAEQPPAATGFAPPA